MENNITDLNRRKAFSPNTIFAIGVALSFLPAAILYSLNYTRLGKPDKKKLPIIVAICLLTIFILIHYVTSYHLKIDDIYIRILILILNIGFIIYFYGNQQVLFEKLIDEGGQKVSNIKVVLYTIVSIVLIGFFIYGLIELENKYNNYQLDKAQELFENNKYIEAEKYYYDLKDDYPEVCHIYLSMIYWNTQRKEKAIKEIKFLLINFPDDKDIAEFVNAFIQENNIDPKILL